MEILEKECLDRLNKILSKFDLKIEFFHIKSNAWYRLVDNSLSKNTYSNWLGLWISISNMLMHRNSIFECLDSYHTFITNVPKCMSIETRISYQRYSEAYNVIKHLENISSLEEFIIRCDIMGI
jgi:hypothetical protein